MELHCILMAIMCQTSVLVSQPDKGFSKPNIVLIMADDLGIGDIGCFGNDTINTPNIDSMARDGVKMTQFLAASATCTPSRAAFLTGRYPVRSGLAGSDSIPVLTNVAVSGGLPSREITLAELAKNAGYKTAIIGKWHLGLNRYSIGDHINHPNNQGFDHFYGTPFTNMRECGEGEVATFLLINTWIYNAVFGSLLGGVLFTLFLFKKGLFGKCTMFVMIISVLIITLVPFGILSNSRRLNSLLVRDEQVIEQPIRFNNLTQRLVSEANTFLQERKADQIPFLLFVSWLQVHTILHTSPAFEGKSLHGRYGDNVEEMDWGVGEILKQLKELDLMSNSFVMFTSDHGGHVEERGSNGEKEGGHNGIFRGGKMQGGMEGGIRVPTTIIWPGQLTPGHVINEPLSMMDVFATVAELVGQDVPEDRIIDGHSLIPILTDEMVISPHEFLFHWCADQIHAVRWRPRQADSTVWKIRYATPAWIPGTEECKFACSCGKSIFHKEPLVFDLEEDPREENPLENNHPMYGYIISVVEQAEKKHIGSIEPVENQLSFWNSMWKPQLQPCCNFPFCNCHE